MSYELGFWKYKKGIYMEPQTAYEQLCEGNPVTGIETIPVEKILKKISIEFITWERTGLYDFESETEGSFQVTVNDQFVRIDCYEMDEEDMNVFIDILLDFDCPLYDPQVPQRFDEDWD